MTTKPWLRWVLPAVALSAGLTALRRALIAARATSVSGRPWVIKRVAAVPGDRVPPDRVRA